MLNVKQKYCTKCGSELKWELPDKPAFFDPIHGQPRFYVRGECPAIKAGKDRSEIAHSYGVVQDYGPHGWFPLVFGPLDDHPAMVQYLDNRDVVDALENDVARGVGGG